MALFLMSLSSLSSGCEPDCYDCDVLDLVCIEDVDCNDGSDYQCLGEAFCNSGQCDVLLLPSRTPCTANDGTFCHGGSCLQCLETSDCTEELCRSGQCVSLSCGDTVLNGDETDIDCGGVCGPCEAGENCESIFDCQYPYSCISGVCDVLR